MGKINVEESLDASELQIVRDGMGRHTRSHVDWEAYERVSITLRDDNQSLKGAALGEAGRGWLKISIIWLRNLFVEMDMAHACLPA